MFMPHLTKAHGIGQRTEAPLSRRSPPHDN